MWENKDQSNSEYGHFLCCVLNQFLMLQNHRQEMDHIIHRQLSTMWSTLFRTWGKTKKSQPKAEQFLQTVYKQSAKRFLAQDITTVETLQKGIQGIPSDLFDAKDWDAFSATCYFEKDKKDICFYVIYSQKQVKGQKKHCSVVNISSFTWENDQ